MRLIDADAFIEMMENKCDHTAFADGMVLAICRGAINSMPTATQWIPVSERLPERGERVLLYDLDGGIYLGHLATGCNYYYADYCDDRIKNVLAWCELPEPFKGVTT